MSTDIKEKISRLCDPEKGFEDTYESFLKNPETPLPLEFAGPDGKKWLRKFYQLGGGNLSMGLMLGLLTKSKGGE